MTCHLRKWSSSSRIRSREKLLYVLPLGSRGRRSQAPIPRLQHRSWIAHSPWVAVPSMTSLYNLRTVRRLFAETAMSLSKRRKTGASRTRRLKSIFASMANETTEALRAITHGACMVLPGESFEPRRRARAVEAERCHLAVRRADDVHRRARRSRTSSASTSRRLRTGIDGRRALPGRGDEAGARADAHGRGHDRLRHDRDLAGLDPDGARTTRSRSASATVGRVHPHVEVKIVDPQTGATVPRGTPGEQCTRGYSVMLGYWDDDGGHAPRRSTPTAGCTPATSR